MDQGDTLNGGCSVEMDWIETEGKRKADAWLETHHPCAACRAQISSDAGMAVLEGASGRVYWAGDIRQEMIARIERAVGQGLIDKVAARDVAGWVKSMVDSEWFIEHRLDTLSELIAVVGDVEE